jgi:hypothetical protein
MSKAAHGQEAQCKTGITRAIGSFFELLAPLRDLVRKERRKHPELHEWRTTL